MEQAETKQFERDEAQAGFILAFAAVIAFALANSFLSAPYETVLQWRAPFLGQSIGSLSVEQWIKEGLMTIFFFVVGLELKWEFFKGELSRPGAVVLPVVAALGGMIAPALLYLLINAHGNPHGWPVPVATDIAFALAALVTVARGVPASIRIFLLTLAIVDDLGAVVLIAILYTKGLNVYALGGMAFTLLALILAGLGKRTPGWIFAAGAVLVWGLALGAGINTSVAGVAAAFTLPLAAIRDVQKVLLPISSYVVLPLFAMASAGISLHDVQQISGAWFVPAGIALGLVIGKPVGVLLASYAAVGLRWARLPAGATPTEMLGVACLCGIGFTMSLFVSALAFKGDAPLEVYSRLGVITGSILSLIAGGAVFAYGRRQVAKKKRKAPR